MEIMFLTLALVIGVIIYFYNCLVKNLNFVKDAWSGIEVQLTKRHDLIPMLVKTVRVYSKYESNLLQSVTALRAPDLSSKMSSLTKDEQAFGDEFSRLMMLVEDYPDIKADQNFQMLQQQLVEIEGDIESARRYYNGSVRDLNILVESFPSNLIANLFSFQQRDFFKLRLPAVADNPNVKL